MSTYRVFARKYRPQLFDEVVGQEHVTRTLKNAISEQRVAQAYLFVGPRGIGKTSCARILAKALNCKHSSDANPCGKCDSCLEIAEGNNLDVIEIDGASNNQVDNIRNLRENAAYSPASGRYKIYLIDEVHMLTTSAFNALLKTLEEPPAHVKFIFATTEAQKVPATITSRCQRFDLRRIPTDSIAKHLAMIAKNENILLDEKAASAIARAAEGGLRDAESMLDQLVAFCGQEISFDSVMQIFGLTPQETVHALVTAIFVADTPAALEIIRSQSEAGKDLSSLMGEVTSHLRDRLVQNVESGDNTHRENLLTLLDHFAETESRLRSASDKKLHFDVATIKAIHLISQASLDDVLAALTALRTGTGTAPAVAPTYRPPQIAPSAASNSPIPVPPAASAPTNTVPPDITMAWFQFAQSCSGTLAGWICDGVFRNFDGKTLHIDFPLSSAGNITMLGAQKSADAETHISDILEKKIKVVFSTSANIPEPQHISHPAQETIPNIPNTSSANPAPPTSQASAQSRQDPIAQKAVNIFDGQLQSSSAITAENVEL